jgi:alpha-D-ribose 1-methylphosphonate 5-triphosphate synthase subunit PhnG
MAVEARRRWMSVLACATPAELASAWAGLGAPPPYRVLRGPECGLVMVRGRAGGTGAEFNLGEMTVTRCSVQLADGVTGHAWVRGRSASHAEQAAVLDALLQDASRRPGLEAAVVAPLAEGQASRRQAARARVAPSRVEFFTMVRGDE